MDPASRDAQLRQAAFDQVNRLAVLRGGVLDSADLAGGFDFRGARIPLINPQRGIFKPRQTLQARRSSAARLRCCRHAYKVLGEKGAGFFLRVVRRRLGIFEPSPIRTATGL